MNSSQHKERTWRDDVIGESLSGFGWREYEKAFLQALLRVQPELATCLVFVNRRRALNFLDLHCSNVRWLLSGPHSTVAEGEVQPHVGWCELEWQAQRLELAFMVGSGNEDIFCLGAAAESVDAFAKSLARFADEPSGRCLRYSEGWEDAPELDAEIGRVTWSDIVLKPETLARLRDSVEGFASNQDMMRDFGFAWKRGILLIGPPGTGKTMVCKAAASALPDFRFLYVRDLREENKKDSVEAIFKRARALSPCILAFEDLDGFINEHNRTVFLNEMDGFSSNDGLLIIASSNHPGKIDEALLKRPSRFDRVFHLGLPELPDRRAFCEKVLTRDSLASKLSPGFDIAKLCDEVAQKSDGFTPAYLRSSLKSPQSLLAMSRIMARVMNVSLVCGSSS